MNLNVIFNAIVPDNIRDLPLVKYCSEIFIEQLNRNSTVAQRISKIFDVDSTNWLKKDSDGNLTEIKDTTFLKETKNNLKSALFQIYLNVLYNLVEKIQSNPDIKSAVDLRNYENSIINKDIYNSLNTEYLGGFRYFQQNSGTKSSINYIYQFAKYLETGYIVNDLNLTEEGTFNLKYQGSLHKRFFSNFNQPMAHPCGWCYEYETILELILEDYFGIKITYNLPKECNVRTNEGHYIVFTKKTINELYDSLSSKNNFYSANPLSIEEIENIKNFSIIENTEIKNLITESSSNNIVLVRKEYKEYRTWTDNNLDYTLIVFDDDTCLFFNGSNLFYGDLKDIYETDKLYQFPNNYFLNIGTKEQIEELKTIEIQYKDEVEFLNDFYINKVDSHYFLNKQENKFQLTGNEYPFVFGVDESKHLIQNYEDAQSNYDAFNVSIDFISTDLTYLKAYDDFGHNYTLVRENENKITFNTHDWYNKNLNFVAYSQNGAFDYYMNISNLNNKSSTITVNSISTKDIKLVLELSSTLKTTCTFRVLGHADVVETFKGSKTISIDTNSYDAYNDYIIILENSKDKIVIESNGLNNNSLHYTFNVPKYSSTTTKTLSFTNCTPLTMKNIKSSGKTIGQMNDGLKTLTWKNNTIVEPSGYYDLNSDNYDGCTFISEGFEKVQCEYEDNLIPCSTKYVDDEFDCYVVGYGHYLIFENDKDEGSDSLGKYLVCNYNVERKNKQGIRSLLCGNVLTFSS